MASRYEIVNYIKDNHSNVASRLGDDKSIYEWARKRYLTDYPTWDEVDAKVNIDETDTANFKEPKNQVQESNLKGEDSSPEKFNWLKSFLTYGGVAEEALGKGILPKSVNLIEAISKGVGIDDDYWEQAYNNSMAGLMYNAFTGEDKYTVEQYHDGGVGGAIVDGSSFVMGMLNPVDAMLFAVSGGAGKAGTALAEAGIKRTFVKKGMEYNAKALAGNRPFLRSMISQGVGTSASLGTFFAGQGAVGETARQSKAIKSGEMNDFDTGEIIKKAVEHGKEGLIVGSVIGAGIGGSMGTRYGQLVLKGTAEGKNLTRFENVQKLLTHPIPRVGAEGAMFTVVGNLYRGEDVPSLGSPEWWEQFIHSTTVIAGLKGAGKLWGKALGKKPSEYGEDADRILMEGLKDAQNFSDGMEKSLKGVEANVGDLGTRVKEVLDSHITEAGTKKGLGEGDLKMVQADINERKRLFSEFNQKGAEMGMEKMKRLIELTTEHENILKSVVDDLISDPTKAYEIVGKAKVKKILTDSEKKQTENYLQDLSSNLTQLQSLRNASQNGGVNIPKEGINTGVDSKEVPLDGTTNTSVNKDGTIKIYPAGAKIPAHLRPGAPKPVTPVKEVSPILTEIKTSIEKMVKSTPTEKGTMSESVFETKQALRDKIVSKPETEGEILFNEKIGQVSPSKTGDILKNSDNVTSVAFTEWGADKYGTVARDTARSYVVGAEKLVKFLSDRKKSVEEMTSSDINEFLKDNAKTMPAIQGVRSFVEHLKNNKYISDNTYNNVWNPIKARHADLQWVGKPGEVGARKAAIEESKKLGKDYETLAELTSYYGVRDLEANKLRKTKGELIKQDPESGEWYLDFSRKGEIGKRKTVPRVIYLDADIAKKLKSYLETAEPLKGKENWTTKLNRALKPIFGKSQMVKDVRKRLETRTQDLSAQEYRLMKWMHGHEVSKMPAGYEGLPLPEFLKVQKTIREKMKYKEFGRFEEVKAPVEKLKVGDVVQWTSKGVDQFAKPKKITSLINGHATVEGSKTGIPIKDLSKVEAKKRIAPVRPKEEVIFKSKAERDVALKDFMARNKMTPESLKEAKLGKNEMGEFMDGAIKLAKGEWQPIDFFHENAHRLKYYAESNNSRKLLNLFKQGEKLAEGSKEYKAWLAKNKDVKNPVEEFFTDVIAGEGVAREFNKGFVNRVKQWTNRMVSAFKVAFNKGDYRDISRLLAKKVQKGFGVKGGIKTGEKKFRVIEGVDVSEPREYIKAIKSRIDKLIEQYGPSVQDKAEIIKIIGEDAGLKDFKLSTKSKMEDIETFYNHFVKNIPIADIPKKVAIASWFRHYRTAETSRLRANVSNEAQKGWLQTLGVSEGNIFRADVNQLKNYEAILHTMKYEKRSDVDWIDNKLMSSNVSADQRRAFLKYGGLRQGAYPVHMVFEGMGLKKLARSMADHASIEQGHIGTWINFENDSKRIVGNRKWNKYKDFMYLFDRDRYIQRKEAGKLSRAEENFINKATTREWRTGTDKSLKNMFTNSIEGKLGKRYLEFTDYYPKMLNDVLSLHMNNAELVKWKENNHVRWVDGKVYVHRGLTDKFKKLMNPRGEKYERFVKSEATRIAEKRVVELHGKKYTTEQYSKVYDQWAMPRAWSELHDMFSFSSEKFSSKFLEKRHIKLPEFVTIDGKKIEVYKKAYEETISPYAAGMAKLFANLEVFPEFVKLKGFKTSDAKEVMGKLEAIDAKRGKWVTEQVNRRLGIGDSPTGDIANTFVRASQKYATMLSKLGLSFPTAGLKNITVGNTQTILAFKVRDFVGGMWDAMARDNRKSVQKTGATELGLRHHEEIRTFNVLDKHIFKWGGMKPTENINRYISVLAGRRDQSRGIEILQRYGSDSKKYKKVSDRFKRFYFLSNKEVGILREYGMNGVEGKKFNNPVDKARISRELDRVYQKMDTYAHINTQGASVDVFMPYWWNKGYVKPFTLFKRMAYAATVNTNRNMKDAWHGRNFMKMATFGLGTMFTGEVLMGIQNQLLGTPFPTKDEEGMKRIGVILWKSEFGGILSELNRLFFDSYDQVGFQIYPSIAKHAEDTVGSLLELSTIWGDMENVDLPTKAEFTVGSLERFLGKSVSLYSNLKKLILKKKSKYNTDYKQQKTYFKEFSEEMNLESNIETIKHTNNYYWELFENAWNRSYMTGNKEEFQRVFWLTFWGVANDYHLRGSNEDGIPLRTQGEAIKEAAKNMKSKMKALNPNKYTFSKKSKMGKIKALKFRLWLGEPKAKQLDSLESQYWKNIREWWGKDIGDSMNKFYLQEMVRYFK